MNTTRHPLGRREAIDPLDARFPMRAVLPDVIYLPTYRYWSGWRTHLDQTGDTCVANGWTHFLTDSPRSHALADLDTNHPGWAALSGGLAWTPDYRSPQSGQDGFRGYLYDQAQQLDEFSDTPPSGGTSVRAGAKVLQALGAIKSYHWAASMADVTTALLTTGPVVIGITWYESMFDVDPTGFIRYDPSSGVAGGHCVKIDGVNTTDKKARVKNSWGRGWGDDGYFWIHLDQLNHLLFADSGAEACIALEP